MKKITGTLYIVGLPIGNIADLGERAKSVLADVDLIAAEDTRKTGLILKELGIKNNKTSLHEFNQKQKSESLAYEILEGKNIALVSDAGMPIISDPGFNLLEQAKKLAIPIQVIPGPTALTTAIAISGFAGDRFIFEGFLPKKTKQIREKLTQIKNTDFKTIVFYESPHRILKTLNEVLNVLGDINLCIARELTKKYQEILYFEVSRAIEHFKSKPPKGEFTIVIGL